MKKKQVRKRRVSSTKPVRKTPVAAISRKSKAELVKKEKEKTHAKPYPIVAIGASAGGLEAVSQLLKNLSPTTGMAYVYIQHLDPTHESMLSSILAKETEMPVMQAEEKMIIQPDHLFVIPPNKDMEIVDGVLSLNSRPLRPQLHMPINRFFMSLAEKQKDGAIGVVLSGNASDGTLGLKAIKAAGGITFAQDESAKFRSMPQSAVAEGAVDMVLPPAKIAKELERLSRYTHVLKPSLPEIKEEQAEEKPEEDLPAILLLLRKSAGVDFSNYKKNTIYRRIERRMLLLKLHSFKDYHNYLKDHAGEVQLLFNDMLINVTGFFRDEELSDYLKSTVLPKIVKQRSNNDPIRIWVPACSTGQEAYSVAMLLMEVLGNRAANTPIQIFASDLSEGAINKARMGLYSKSEVADVSQARLQRFFTKEDNNYRIVKSIRERCVFAVHNIFKDPPFSRLDLVSCCNLLIYLDNTLQKRALGIFHYALNADGFLVLGKTETTTAATTLFAPLSKKLKVYGRKKDGHARAIFDASFRSTDMESAPVKHLYHTKTEQDFAPDLEKTVDTLLLNRYIPACVLVNEDLEILQFRGSTGMFLEPSPGKASLNLIKMAREGLDFELRNAVHKATKTDKAVFKSGIEMKNKTVSHLVNVEVIPVKNNGAGKNFLILFREDMAKEPPVKGKIKDKRVQQLEQELIAVREDMGAVIEEREALNEELQSANEEVVSSNEELQSINEELETSKEEIESTNEELQTINQELLTRNDQLAEAFGFADAVFTTMREALLVLDADLRIVRANNKFYKSFNTTEEETERRLIYELGSGQWNIPRLRELLEEIIPRNNEFYGFEVSHFFPSIGEKLMVLNARKMEQPASRQQLVLLAIEDVTDHVVAERVLRERELWFRNMANDAPVMIWTSDEKGNRIFFNKTWLEFTGKDMKEEAGMGWIDEIHPDDQDKLLLIYKDAHKKRLAYQLDYRLKRNDGQYRWVQSSGKPVFDIGNQFIGFIGTVTEVHDQKVFMNDLERKVQERTNDLVQLNARLARSNSELQQFAYVASHDLQEPLRKIRTFSDRLEHEFRVSLPEGARLYFDKISKSANHMTALIEDLLNFSQVSADGQTFVETDLNQVLKSVLSDFELRIAEKDARITVGKLPTIAAIRHQMKQLFQNLLSNSLKFAESDLNIEVSARKLNKEELKELPARPGNKTWYEIRFSDTGIGFRQEFAEQIFVIFQRLHGKSKYPGTGIGLALCRKIVTMHGGYIFAKSEENKGTDIFIVLPQNQPDQS